MIPDESGMAEEEVELGVPTYDWDTGAWVVWENRFHGRRATPEEIARARVTRGPEAA